MTERGHMGTLTMQMENSHVITFYPTHESRRLQTPSLQGHMGPCGGAAGAGGTHALTHIAGGRCRGPAHARPSGQAWAGSSRYM